MTNGLKKTIRAMMTASLVKATEKQEKSSMANSNILRGGKLNANAGIEAWYMRELEKLCKAMTKECVRELEKLYSRTDEQITFAEDDSISSQMRIKLNYLRKKYGEKFADKSKDLSKKLLSKLITYSWVAVTASIKQIAPDIKVRKNLTSAEEEAVKAAIFENVSLIKSIPEQYFKEITGVMSRAILGGQGIESVIPHLAHYEGVTWRRAKNIARDQAHKTYEALSLRRFRTLGFTDFEWIHSGGSQRPRDYHKYVLNHKIFPINDPPRIISGDNATTGYPGDLPGCRCTMRPIIKLEEEK